MRELGQNNIGVGIVMLIQEVIVVGCNTLNKAATNNGMSNYIFVTYSHGIGLFFLLPTVFLVHKNSGIPPIGSRTIWKMLVLSVVSYGCSIFTYVGISYSSPTLASAINNLSPVSTFIIAIVVRMEKLNLRARSTWLKLIGTMISIGGAFTIVCYRGFPILGNIPSPKLSTLNHSVLDETQPNWVIGGLLFACSSTFLSLTYITKTWIARDFHSEVFIIMISFFFETVVAAIVALVVEKDINVWIPSVDIVLIAFVAGGAMLSAANVGSTWACRKKGPLFVAMFRPIEMIIAAVMGLCLLNDRLYFGSVVGATIITIGFYMVMKGKADEEKVTLDNHENKFIYCYDETSSNQKVPLLDNNNIDTI